MAISPSRFRVLLIVGVALALMVPELIGGLSVSHSFRYNLVWTEQFRDMVRAGELYPHWLPSSWGGLGSPTFYFYPPLYFWLAACLDALTLHLLPVGGLVSATSFVLLAVSGLAMRAWLAGHVEQRRALIGAVAYMAMPYHLFDIYLRGAVAEAGSYAFLPLIMLSVQRLGEGRKAYVPLLAAAYAALILTHLPTALLTSVTVLPLYALFTAFRCQRPLPTLALIAAAGLLGICLAAAYLLPAVTLQRFISTDALFSAYYSPDQWFFWRPEAWPLAGIMWLVIPTSAALLLLAAASAWAAWKSGRREGPFWAAMVLFAILLVSGAMPFLWNLPYLAQVQFPFRMMVIAEFALITGVAIATPPLRTAFAGAAPLAFAAAVAGSMVASQTANALRSGGGHQAAARIDYRDAPEYLPPGVPVPLNAERVPDGLLIRIPGVPLASSPAPGAEVKAIALEEGGMEVDVDSPIPADLVVRRFHFPHWRVMDASGSAVRVRPSSPERLLSWRAPAGRSRFRVEPGAAPGEREGLAVSALALLLLGAWAAFLVRRALSAPWRQERIASLESSA
jgi:hypothetical protein